LGLGSFAGKGLISRKNPSISQSFHNMRRTQHATVKPKRRSTSRKRSSHLHSTSKPQDSDDDLLVKALNERASSDREVLVSKEQYEDLKQAKKTLKSTSAQLAAANKELAEMQVELKTQQGENARLQKEGKAVRSKRESESQDVKELTYANSQLSKQLEEARASAQEQHKKYQTALTSLRASLADINQMVATRTAAATRHVSKAQALLSQAASALSKDIPKVQIARMIAESSQQIEQLMTVLTSTEALETSEGPKVQELEEENERLKDEVKRMRGNEDILEQYRAAIEKLREQVQILRDRNKELESGEDFRRQLEDKDARIALLTKEKDMCNEHVRTLQATLNEQRVVIENLRSIISKVSSSEKEEYKPVAASPRADRRRTPSMTDFPKQVESVQPVEDLDSRIERVYIGEANEVNIQAEIASLDQEIMQLQSSLQRALENP